MSEDHVARASVDIPASAGTVWDTLVDPEATWMLGARVTSTYAVGDPITFDGVWDGRPFQDHGEIVEVDRPRRLRYTHFSPLSGQPDVPENYHHLTFTLEEHAGPPSSRSSRTATGRPRRRRTRPRPGSRCSAPCGTRSLRMRAARTGRSVEELPTREE